MPGSIPNRLRYHRTRAGFTQQQLADRAGAGRVTIVRAEQGSQEPSLDLARRLAEVLDCGLDDLFGNPEARIASDTPARPAEVSKARLRELRAEKRKAPTWSDLNETQFLVMKAAGVLEGIDVEAELNTALLSNPDYVFVLRNFFEDVERMQTWVDYIIGITITRLDDRNIIEKIAKLRDTNGRTPQEAATARKLADRLQRKLDAKLDAGIASETGVGA